MKLVIIESPLKGNYERNREYARACMRDSLMRGEAPFASHLLYDQPGVLDDTLPEERAMGMEAGFEWGKMADLIAVYTNLGISEEMKKGIAKYEDEGKPIQYRTLSTT